MLKLEEIQKLGFYEAKERQAAQLHDMESLSASEDSGLLKHMVRAEKTAEFAQCLMMNEYRASRQKKKPRTSCMHSR